MSVMIRPTPISGFPEFLPAEQILFGKILATIRQSFELYGFAPIETPAVERKDVLTSKGGNEREIYALSRLAAAPGENPDTDLALHFDLTVPLARYVAMYKDKLAFPFRRYQIQKVWRGERAQSGRYREFYQCDIDVIGKGDLSLLTDAEIPSIIYQIFHHMRIGPFVIRVNNRKILQGYFHHLGIPTAHQVDVMRLVDKLEKIGTRQLTAELMAHMGLTESTAGHVIAFLDHRVSNDEMLAHLRSLTHINDRFAEGVRELEIVVEGLRTLNVPEDAFRIDLGIARGLDYYTGTVYETILVDYPGIGSICSGGRYDDLASFFTEEQLPGVGISIGLTRLVPRLIEAGILKVGSATTAPVLVTSLEESRTREYLRIGTMLREAGVPTEVYFEKARLGEQLRYAHTKGFTLAIIAGERELAHASVKVKNLRTGDESTHVLHDLPQTVEEILRASA